LRGRWRLGGGAGFSRFLLGFDAGRVSPEALKIVLFPDVGAHDVNDDVEKVQHLPGGADVAIDGAGAQIVVGAEFVGDFVDDGADVRLAGSREDDEVIRHRGNFANVKYNRIFSLFIFGQFAAEKGQFFGIHLVARV